MREGWETVCLADVCTFKPPKKEARQRLNPDDLVSFVPMNNLGVRKKALELGEERPLEKVAGGYTYFADGDVLLAKITPCFENGKLGIASGLTNGIGFGSSEFIVMRPSDELDAEYLFYFLSQDSFLNAGASVMSGAVGHKRIPKEFIEQLEFPLPNRDEQKGIVAMLDEAFEGIDSVFANTEKNIANARDLFESYLDSVLSKWNNGWVEKPLNLIANFSQGIQVGLREQSKIPGVGLVRFIRIIDYTQGGDGVRYVKNPGDKYWAKNDDIVMVRYGSPGLIGRGIEGVIANNLFKITIIDGSVSNDYLTYFLSQRKIKGYLSSQGSSTMPALTFKQLGQVVVSFPCDLEVQNKLVEKIDELFLETQRIEFIYQQKLTALAELKQSLLQKAFSGELMAREIEAAVEEAST